MSGNGDWGDLTVADLEAMGLTLEDLDSIMGEQGTGMDYGSYGVLDPIDISKQATQWDVLDAQKTARAANAPPSPTERRLSRNFIFPNPDEFSYDAALQANPYIRQLLIDAVGTVGPDDPYGANAWLAGKDQEDEWAGAVDKALPDFENIADTVMFDDPDWATTNEDKQRALLTQYLQSEGENWLAGAAPSASRNTNWADWAENRRPGSGEQFPMFEGAGFDQGQGDPQQGGGGGGQQRGGYEPRVRTDPSMFSEGARPDAAAEMSAYDFRKAYQNTLLKNTALLEEGDRVEDPDGGYWVISKGSMPKTAVERKRRSNKNNAARTRLRRRGQGDDSGDSTVGRARRSWQPTSNPISRWLGDRVGR